MILILSVETDFTTIEITNWLDNFKVKYKVIYASDFISKTTLLDFDEKGILNYIENKIDCKLSDLSVVWFRKWSLNSIVKDNFIEKLDFKSNRAIFNSSISEIEEISSFLLDFFPKDKIINNIYESKNSKLFQLFLAKKNGLNIPQTKVLNNKLDLIKFNNSSKKGLITKPMNEVFSVKKNERHFTTFTSRVLVEKTNSDTFLPSLFQYEIKKKYEVRTFVFGNQFYSMAIFSQSNQQTEVDFRNYDQVAPNRNAKYNLPIELENKIIKLLSELKLETASIDFIVDENNNHIFLEANPYGQFGMVSKPNNYNLEKKFAEYLINYGKNIKSI